MIRLRSGRTIAVLVITLLLAVLVVRTATVDAFVVSNPATARAAWPGHPAVILASGLKEVGEAAANAQPANPATVRAMLAAAAKAPLAPEPFLVRGVEAQVAGDRNLAGRAFLEARGRDPRSVPARYFLADHYLKTGQTQLGLAEIAALTRLVPKSLDQIAPQLAAFARLPGGGAQARRLLRDQPQLEPWLLGELAADPGDANLALAIWSGRTTDMDRTWQQRLVTNLVAAGRIGEARAAWGRFNPGVRPVGELFDPKFEGRAIPPFGWTLASGAAGVAEPEDGGRLHIIYYGRDNVVLASQLLQLRPGPYRLSMRVSTASPNARAISWIVRCTPPSRDLASIALTAAKDEMLTADFTIPPQDCSTQQLDLVGSSPDLPEQTDLSIAGLSLSRRAP